MPPSVRVGIDVRTMARGQVFEDQQAGGKEVMVVVFLGKGTGRNFLNRGQTRGVAFATGGKGTKVRGRGVCRNISCVK